MDTKSRIALFAGGLVLVGFVAWLLLPAHKAPEESAGDSSTTASEIASTPATPPTTEPVAAGDPFAASPTTQPVATAAPSLSVGPNMAPADGTDAWARALDGNAASSNTITVGGTSTSMLIPALHESEPVSSAKTYKVQPGDTLFTIAEKALGNGNLSGKILAANPGLNPKKLKAGQEIKLPGAGGSETLAPSSVSKVPASPAAASASKNSYKVQAGDSLRKIANRVYGDSRKWNQIYAANKSTIGSDPSHLRAGMTLRIP